MPADRFSHPKERQHDGISRLKDFEFRVWDQYKLSADDFGVMERAPWRVKADNPALGCRSDKSILQALDRLEKLGIVRSFEHNGRTFLYQHDWQTFQKIDYPRPTVDPKPPGLESCDEATRRLFDKHPGGQGRKRGDGSPNVLRTDAELSQTSATTRAQPREEAKANGSRLEASGSLEGGVGETAIVPAKRIGPRGDWLKELVRRYPKQRSQPGYVIETAFNAVFSNDDRPDESVWSDMLLSLQSQIEGYEWRVKGMIPNLDNWLTGGKCFQRHERAPVSTVISEKTARNLTAAEQFLKAGNE
jgi:hypothetical protein